jgi:hypothetical protein
MNARVAIATYVDDNENLINEFRWLHRSWMYSGAWRMSQIVAFHNPSIDMTQLPLSDVHYVPLPPCTERNKDWAIYPFINSVEFMTTPEAGEILTDYPFVLRTDNDVFLTPYFPQINPRLALFGIGMYAAEPEVVVNLALIHKKWGIPYVHNNVGSTFYAETSLALQYAFQQNMFCDKLRKEEFPEGVGQWPQWYFGVLSMYAGLLAANNLFGYSMTLGGLDVNCTSDLTMQPTDFHIHAFHTFDYFSKFKWREGKYRKADFSVLNRGCISDYCLWIAGPGPEVRI